MRGLDMRPSRGVQAGQRYLEGGGGEGRLRGLDMRPSRGVQAGQLPCMVWTGSR